MTSKVESGGFIGFAKLTFRNDVFGRTEIGAYAEYAVSTRLFPKPGTLLDLRG